MSTRSFFPWCGGKNHTISKILPSAPEYYNNYFEPFLGVGSMLYALQPKTAYVNDINFWVIGNGLAKRQFLFVDDFSQIIIDFLFVNFSKMVNTIIITPE